MSLSCPGCVAREQQLADLRRVLKILHGEVRASLGPATRRILDQMAGHEPETSAEIAQRIGSTKGVVRVILLRLQNKGLVKRCGWRDSKTGRLPSALYQAVSAQEFIDNWSQITAA